MIGGSTGRRFGLAVAVLAPLTISWSLGIGRYGGPDEPAHVLRSYAAAHGEVLGASATPLPAGYRYVTVPASLASGDPSCYRHDPTITSQCAEAGNDDSPVRAATSAGLTPPLYHLAVGALVRLVGDPADTTSYRVIAALLHALVLALVVVCATAPGRRPPLQRLLACAVVITPATWFLFGVVNPNSIEVALALLAWTGMSRVVAGRTNATTAEVVSVHDVLWVGVPLGFAVAVRPIAAVFAGAAVAIVLLGAEAVRRSRRLVIALVAPAVLAAAAQAVWVLVVDVEIDDPRTAVDRSVLASLSDALGALPTTAVEAVGALGWNEFRAPWWAMLIWSVVAAVCVVTILGRARPRRGAVVLAVWAVALVVTPVVFEVVFAASVGPIWQGRYSLPILVGVIAVAVIARRRDEPSIALRFPSSAMVALMPALATVEAATYWAMVRRYAVGTDGSWWLDDAVASTAWMEPRAWVVVHTTFIAAIATAGVVVVRRCSRTRR